MFYMVPYPLLMLDKGLIIVFIEFLINGVFIYSCLYVSLKVCRYVGANSLAVTFIILILEAYI